MKGLLALALVLALPGCGQTAETTPRDRESGVLPIVFPDGTEAELVYPQELALEQLPVHPYSSARLRGKSPNSLRDDEVARDFWIQRGEVRDILVGANNGKEPRLVAEYRGADGSPVGFWSVSDDGPYLGFQFGGWAVLVYDYTGAAAMTEEERATWAASLTGHETSDGFLLLEGTGPLRLARAGEHAGPELSFGEPGVSGFSLFPGRCVPHRDMDEIVSGQRVDRSPGFADWCLSPLMRIHALGSESSIGALLAGLDVRDVRLPSRPVR